MGETPSDADQEWVLLGDELAAELRAVTLEEFRLTEARYETDTRLGRELLFLLSNAEWSRRTTEVIDVSRVSAVETRLTVDVDTSYIAHEALRGIDGPLWLPLFALPSSTDDPDLPAVDGPAEPPIGVDITDAEGVRVAGVPQAEVRRQLAAALAETVVTRLDRRPAGPVQGAADPGRYGREHQVLLAAMLTQLLTRPPLDNRLGRPREEPQGPLEGGSRLGRARNDLQRWLDADRWRLRRGQRGPGSVLASREAEIVQALRGSTFAVVPVRPGPPTSFTMVTPTRALMPDSRRDGASAVRLRIAVLAPTTHADRVVEVLLPDGVRLRDDGARSTPSAVVDVAVPQQFEQLRTLVGWIVDRRTDGWPRKQLAELAGTKLESVVQCLHHHYDSFDPPDVCTTDAMLADLRALREPLDRLATVPYFVPAREPTGDEEDDPVRWVAELARRWPPVRERLATMTLRRRIDRSTTSPGSVRFRASAIEEFTIRAQPTQAYLDIVLESRDSPVLGTARAVNKINMLVLAGVAAMLLLVPIGDNSSRSEVLAALLTFFPAIQASRLRQPDATRLAGLLTMRHFTAGLATAVPGLLLAGVLAFEPDGAATKAAAVVAVLAQLACHLWILDLRRSVPLRSRWPGRLTRLARMRPWRRRVLTLRTVRSPDHRRFDVLRTAWCRSLTGDVLLVGRTAHPYVVVDSSAPDSFARLLSGSQGKVADMPAGRPSVTVRRVLDSLNSRAESVAGAVPAGAELVAGPANLVGVLRGIAVDRAVTFLIFRDPPQPGWETAADGTDRRITPLQLERGQLAPMEPPDWVLDVMVGFAPDVAEVRLLDHPLATVARAAAAAGFTLLNLQLPAPPLQGEEPLRWLRARVGVPFRTGDSLRGLVGFLDHLQALRDRGIRVHLREVPPTESLEATQTAPEDTFDAPPRRRSAAAQPEPGGEPVTDGQLLVSGAPGSRWRLLSVCARPDAGLLTAVLTAVAENGRVSSLAGVISGVLNGTSVAFLLCRADDRDPGRPPLSDEELSRRLESHPELRGRAVTIQVLPGVPWTRPPCSGPRALLRVQIHTPDRAGVLQDLLRALGHQIERVAGRTLPPVEGAAEEPAVDVLYSLTPVVDGQAISGRMLIRLPEHPGGLAAWEAVRWTELGRRVARTMTRDGGTALADAERTVRRSDDTVVSLDLVRRPPAPPPLPAPDTPAGKAAAGTTEPAAARATGSAGT